jgi:hypothetical protein
MNRSHLPMQKEISRSLSLAASSPSGSERNDSQLAGSRLIRRPLLCKIISSFLPTLAASAPSD